MAGADFTIADVLAWARTKPADERYDFTEAAHCALGQYAREMRGFSEEDAACEDYRSLLCPGLRQAAIGDGERYVTDIRERWTFGRFASRLEALIPAEPVSPTWTKLDAYLTDIDATAADVSRERAA